MVSSSWVSFAWVRLMAVGVGGVVVPITMDVHQMSRPAEVFEPQLVLAELTDLAPYDPARLCLGCTRRAMAYAGCRHASVDLPWQPYESRAQRLCECIYDGGDVPSLLPGGLVVGERRESLALLDKVGFEWNVMLFIVRNPIDQYVASVTRQMVAAVPLFSNGSMSDESELKVRVGTCVRVCVRG
jgi:hypothetical protein